MFNNKKINFFSRYVILTLVTLTIKQQSSFGLDLTIDLPLNTGKTPVLYSSYNSESIEQERKTYNNNVVPPAPSTLLSTTKMKQEISNKMNMEEPLPSSINNSENSSLVTQDKIFPELTCLKENVDFWEKVYNDIDTNEGIVHDRNNLGRVYAIVTLPKGEKAKSTFLKYEKKLIEAKIVSLAKKINSQETLNSQEKNLAKLFSKRELTYNSLMEAAANLRIQTGLKSQFRAGVQRSMNYVPVVFPIVKRSGLPTDLAYLPHVESSYNTRAGSKVGALGLWQLMPSTMRILEGKEAVYKRTDPNLSTRAAMKLLKMNYEKTGSWPLALTAYNHGANGIVRAIQETNSRDLCKIIEHYDSPSFKFASSNFYAQFLAARKVAMRQYKTLANTKRNSILKQTLLTATGGTLR